MVRIETVKPLAGFLVHLRFTDGTERDVDLSPFLRGEVFECLRADPVLFRAVRVDAELGTIVWDNGADIDPDVLYLQREPAWAAEKSTA